LRGGASRALAAVTRSPVSYTDTVPDLQISGVTGRDARGDSPAPLVGIALLLAIALYAIPLALRTPLLDYDEGFHASIAQEMAERGDWVTPRFQGRPFLDKPILFFWSEALSLRLNGMNEAAVRLPGYLFALLGSVTTGMLAWRLFGDRRIGLLGGLCYATLFLPVAIGQAPVHDLALVPASNMALLSLWGGQRASGWPRRFAWAASAGVWLGLSVLAKGLVAVALIGVAFGGFLAVTRNVRRSTVLSGVLVLAVAAIVAAPWYVAMHVRHPGYLHYFFVERHLLGYVTSTQPHGDAPWWYYGPVLVLGGLPWMAYAPLAFTQLRLQRTELARPSAFEGNRFLWFWAASGVVLMSLGRSKLETYILPVFPALAILAAVAWTPLLRETATAAARRLAALAAWAVAFIESALLPLAFVVAERMFDVSYPVAAWAAAGALFPSWWLWLRPWRPPSAGRSFMGILVLQTTALLVLVTLGLPPVAGEFSAKALAVHFNRLGRLPAQLLLANERVGSIVFYLNPELRARLQPDQIRGFDIRAGLDLPAQPGIWVAIPKKRLLEAERLWDLSGATATNVGHYRLYDASALRRRAPNGVF
jgi:4-amino-4-deoxy-L-arabinose transferase-like glycosyltransferase